MIASSVSGGGATDEFMTVKEVAKLLKLSERTVRRHSDAGKMPAPVRVGWRLKRWRRSEIEAYIACRR